jgi:hypothetical protein
LSPTGAERVLIAVPLLLVAAGGWLVIGEQARRTL